MLKINKKFGKVSSDKIIKKTIEALKKNGMNAIMVENSNEAKMKVLELIPKNAEVMNMTSMTIDAINISKEINESGNYNSIRNMFAKIDSKDKSEMRRLGAVHDYVVGSVHAITQKGNVMIASATGSQLPSYSYGAGKVIWVVGAQKIVKDFDEGLKRLYEYSFPLEDERARKAYGMGSGVNKILIINKEFQPDRITIIIVKEKLGF
ncbi:LUD domain-containing protein [Candidatus Woesearchaeota archaeon]|nr:LUD domain-containing protein [Candidatus Woesearchaeota archaeon]